MATYQIELRRVYGTALCFPVNDVAKRFAHLEGRKTLSMDALRYLIVEGNEIKIDCLSSLQFIKERILADLGITDSQTSEADENYAELEAERDQLANDRSELIDLLKGALEAMNYGERRDRIQAALTKIEESK